MWDNYNQIGPADQADQSVFEIVPVPLYFGVQLKLLDGFCAVDVVGDGVTESVWVSRNKVPPANIIELH